MSNRTKVLYYGSWLLAIAGTLGSLYYSEIRHLTPCLLCWYQRILLYPMVALFAVGILKKDKGLPSYILPLSIIGAGVALFHYLLQMGVIPDEVAPCSTGVSCASTYIEYFGFITIPLLSFLAFAGITIAMFLVKREHSKSLTSHS